MNEVLPSDGEQCMWPPNKINQIIEMYSAAFKDFYVNNKTTFYCTMR